MLRPTYPIRTARLLLRPFRPDDLDALHAVQSRDDVTRYLYWSPRTRTEVADVLRSRLGMTALEREGDILVLAVELAGAGTVLGDVNLAWRSVEHRQGEFGFVFHPDHHGHGYAGEAAVEMLRLGFEQLGLHRIIGRADGRNTASARLMEKLGMRREAHFVQNEVVKGEWTDEVVYAMLAREWADR
ncbi:MAG TPA: GNAT family protein [Actinophytocola sp.]|uniref:GNAT family N-acetyltransferase n=1 Tax=Actinophytocola sp. TaxID=1872138 RepID=UPI002DBC001A|nr:GNAT family protein [Actinophytocola sp.]HEU5473916.1 GNAT family protein [Actinophytocola sp.]